MSAASRIGGEVFDSRDVIELLTELREEADEEGCSDPELLRALENLNEWGEDNVPDWQYGETLIREDYFTEYAQQLAEDIGAIDPDAGWPASYIDWEAAADALKMDYTEVEYDGSTYYVRA